MKVVLQILGIVAILYVALLVEKPEQKTRAANPQPAAAQPKAEDRQIYHFNVSVDQHQFPTVTGSTDVPDGTQLFIQILKPHLPDGQQRLTRGLPACEDDCFPAHPIRLPVVDTIVQRGSFASGPYAFGDKPFRPNFYQVQISIVPRSNSNGDFQRVFDSKIWIPGTDGRNR